MSANKNNAGEAITLGSYIYGNSSRLWARTDNSLFMHEYGHYLQSQHSGPLFMYKYGLPSGLTGTLSSGWLGFNGNHDNFWVEQDANTRAWEYFHKGANGGLLITG